MNENDQKLILRLKEDILRQLSAQVKKIIFFGSRAKGIADNDSDLDMIVLVDEKTRHLETNLDDIVYNIMLENDFHPMISLKIFSFSRFNQALAKGYSFYKNVEKDGIII